MSVKETMEEHGFSLSASCGGQASYTKFVQHNGRRAYISLTGEEGESFPGSLDEPVRVSLYDWRSGDEIEPTRDVGSLRAYLESLGE
jgi:hypothetical protein